jgi:hypothetical protein
MKKTAKNYKEFLRRNPEQYTYTKENIDYSNLIYLGTVLKLNYLSDKTIYAKEKKKPVKRIHTHSFKNPHFVFTNAKRNILVVAPTRIDKRGILD